MNRAITTMLVAGIVILVGCKDPVPSTGPKTVDSSRRTPRTQLAWSKTPFGPMASPVLADSAGSHITFVKFPAGMITPPHTHSARYTGLVVSGTTRHFVPGDKSTRTLLAPGSYWSIGAGVVHVSECTAEAECIMAIIQDAPFDFTPVESFSMNEATAIAIYDQVNGFDVDVGDLATKRGHSSAVRKLGAMVARDHRGVRVKLGAMVARDHRGVRVKLATLIKDASIVPKLPSSDSARVRHQEVLVRLRTLSGPEFDRAYLDHEVEFHRAAIEAVKTVIVPAIENTEVRDFVVSVLPAFEHHLAMTIETRKKLGR